MTKVYYVKSIHNGREVIWEGTLECGHSWNPKISNPKTIKTLVNALEKSAIECNCFGDSYYVSSKEEFDNSDNACSMN